MTKHTAQKFVYNVLIGVVSFATCLPLRIILWTPLILVLGLIIAPIAVVVLHLPFDSVPWYKQVCWHYAMLLHMSNVPFVDTINLMKQISDWFLVDLRRKFGHRTKPFILSPLAEISREDFDKLGTSGFKRKYWKTWTPIKVEAFAPNISDRWSLNQFAKEYGETEVYAFRSHLKSETVKIPFRDLAQKILNEDKIYARAVSQILKANPSLLDDLPLSEYAQMRETLMGHDFDNKHALLQFFSAKNTVTQVHADITCNFNLQFEGEKHWLLFPPEMALLLYPYSKGTNQFFQANFNLNDVNLDKYPCLAYARGYCMVMRPGDLLWLPSWYWHGIYNRSTPACSVASDGVGRVQDLFSTNLSMSLGFFAHPYNLLEFVIAPTEEIAKRWTL